MQEPQLRKLAVPGAGSLQQRAWLRRGGSLSTDSIEALLLCLIAITVAALIFGAFLALQGHDPLAVYRTLYLGAFGTRFSLESTLTQAAPLLLPALCTLIPARVALLAIGGEGAVAPGGLAAALA